MGLSDDIEGKAPCDASVAYGTVTVSPEYEEYVRLDAEFTGDRLKILVRKVELVDTYD